jgi:hypothetical protein
MVQSVFEKAIVVKLGKKFPAVYGTVFTRATHRSLSLTTLLSPYLFKLYVNIASSCVLRSTEWLLIM